MRSLRTALIAGFVLLVVQVGVVVALGTSTHGSFVSNLIQLGLGILVVIASLRAAHRSEALGRHIWRLLALAYALWGVAQALSTYGDPFSSGLIDTFFGSGSFQLEWLCSWSPILSRRNLTGWLPLTASSHFFSALLLTSTSS
jgi:hypothetical protein